MSGGSLRPEYVYYQVSQFADELQNEIENNSRKDEYGYSPDYSEEVLVKLREQVGAIRRVAEAMRAIDYLYSGDHGEDSFLRALEKIKEEKR